MPINPLVLAEGPSLGWKTAHVLACWNWKDWLRDKVKYGEFGLHRGIATSGYWKMKSVLLTLQNVKSWMRQQLDRGSLSTSRPAFSRHWCQNRVKSLCQSIFSRRSNFQSFKACGLTCPDYVLLYCPHPWSNSAMVHMDSAVNVKLGSIVPRRWYDGHSAQWRAGSQGLYPWRNRLVHVGLSDTLLMGNKCNCFVLKRDTRKNYSLTHFLCAHYSYECVSHLWSNGRHSAILVWWNHRNIVRSIFFQTSCVVFS